ncbi:phage tail protein [Chloroflexota bacterium]
MSEPFVAEIKIFAGNFAPRSYAFCEGQLLPIAQNTALFSLVGTIYGGDGRTTFGLPNLQGRAAMQPRQGLGLSQRQLGQVGGMETVTLTEAQLPTHNHALQATEEDAVQTDPTGMAYATADSDVYKENAATTVGMSSETTSTGGSHAHNNMQPSLALNYIIALTGVYPSRN